MQDEDYESEDSDEETSSSMQDKGSDTEQDDDISDTEQYDEISMTVKYDEDFKTERYDADFKTELYDINIKTERYDENSTTERYNENENSKSDLYNTIPKTARYDENSTTKRYNENDHPKTERYDENENSKTELYNKSPKTKQNDQNSLHIEDGDPNEDLYEEKIHRVVYRKSSTNRRDFSRTEDAEEQQEYSTKDRKYGTSGRKHDKQDRSGRHHRGRPEEYDKTTKEYDQGHEKYDQRTKGYDQRHEKYDQKKGKHDKRSKVHQQHKRSKSEEEDIRNTYYAVTKWDVDYSNKNYIRSQLNKPGGFHRYAVGRPYEWDIKYDNTNYLRSLVNEPKGLHRQGQYIKRKVVPDNDPLADSSGWEFEYGPMFKQVEEDVPYMTDERRVIRGAYRHYGVSRNDSDCDGENDEERSDFKEINTEEFKYGPEFLQTDVQHVLEQKDGKIGRGAYRHYGVDRNKADESPVDPPNYRDSYSTLTESEYTGTYEDEEDIPKGKPFKHTILKKIVTLGKPLSEENVPKIAKAKGNAQYINFTPGEGSRSFYEGQSLRKGGSQTRTYGAESKPFSVGNSTRTGMQEKKNRSSNAYNKKQSRHERHKPTKKPSYQDSDRGYEQRHGREKQSSKGATLYEMRKQDQRGFSDSVESRSGRKDTGLERDSMDEDEVLKKFPPHVEERIYTLRKRMSRPEGVSGQEKSAKGHHHSQGKSHKEGHQRNLISQGGRLADNFNIDDHIDFKKHLKHPRDHGKSSKTGYEKCVNENGNEVWSKAEESYAELHHLH